MGSYQVALLGKIDDRAAALLTRSSERLTELGLAPGVIKILKEANIDGRNPKLPLICIFLGYPGADDANHPALKSLIEDSVIILTLVSSLTEVSKELPKSLRHINALAVSADGHNLDRAASLILEAFRLLRRERRLFISYKRSDSQAAAAQLYDALDARGFDVFIDTRSVPPAADFQEELWHRLTDSDVVVLLDTPGFRTSRWTTAELARANATNIQILHVLWPGQKEDPASAFSHYYSLDKGKFRGRRHSRNFVHLNRSAIDEICHLAERLRARAIAARYRYLIDGFCDAARDLGLSVNVQAERWIQVDLRSGKSLAVVPIVGVPTSDRINEVSESIARARAGGGGVWVLYDSRGVLSSWLNHLGWLDKYLPTKSIRMSASYQALERVRGA